MDLRTLGGLRTLAELAERSQREMPHRGRAIFQRFHEDRSEGARVVSLNAQVRLQRRDTRLGAFVLQIFFDLVYQFIFFGLVYSVYIITL